MREFLCGNVAGLEEVNELYRDHGIWRRIHLGCLAIVLSGKQDIMVMIA